ncbi:UNVERIFIED_CONTAM: putative pentatricopeptide repeat-containing protein, mitochondrial [Sesamum latifolium]|uniref:Pentatricopeptide repeat-containing protein, mitochondrial n=1 Tax=Sesamum latifolium TaxID=2727402 RepID=A0AAW2XUJ7_9LAMI
MLRLRPQPSVVNFNKLLSVVVKMKRYSIALNVFDKMRQLGIPVNQWTMNMVINCYCLLNRVDFGFAILGSFVKLGYEPNVTTFTTLIKGLFLDDKVVEAEKLFKKLLTLKLCKPNEVTILTVINGLCRAGHTLTAYDLLGLFEETSFKPGVKTYNTVIDSLCKDRMVDDALQILAKMIDKGMSPNIVTYNSVLQGLCNFGKWKDAKDLITEMVDHKVSLNVITFNILVDAFCKEGMVKEAEDVVEIMMQRDISPNVVTYNALIDGYSLVGQIDKARQVFDSMPGRGLKPCVISYSSLINGYCKKGKVEEAWLLFLEVPDKGLEYDVITYNTMLHGLFRAGRFAEGLKFFKDMQAQQVIPNLATYNTLLHGLCMNRQIAEAFSFIHIMKRNVSILIYSHTIYSSMDCVRMENLILHEISSIAFLQKGLLKRKLLVEAKTFLDEMYRRGFSLDSATISLLIDRLQDEGHDVIPLETISKLLPKI